MHFMDKARPIEQANVVFSTSAVVASAALVSPWFAASVALGAVVEGLNFRTMARGASHMFAGEIGANPVWSALFGLRLAMLAGVLFVAIRAGAEPVGLLVGLSMILPAAVVGGWRARPPIDPDAEPLPADDPSWDLWNPWLAREAEPSDEDDEE